MKTDELLYRMYARKQGVPYIDTVCPAFNIDTDLRKDLFERARNLARINSVHHQHEWDRMNRFLFVIVVTIYH